MNWFRIACILMALGIGLGAFGAHGLKNVLSPYLMGVYEKAVFYHITQALGLLLLSLIAEPGSGIQYSRLCLFAGIVIFSGSLYLLAVLDQRWLGMITPIGGTLLIAGWVLAAFSARQ